jgi:methyl-accepting chemotaxis protein
MISIMFNWICDLKTPVKMGLGFGFCVMMVVVVGLTAIQRMSGLNQLNSNISNGTLSSVEALYNFRISAERFRQLEYQYVEPRSSSERASCITALASAQDDANNALKQYSSSFESTSDERSFDNLKASWEAFVPLEGPLKSLVQQGKTKEADKMNDGQMAASFQDIRSYSEYIMQWNTRRGQSSARDADSSYLSARSFIIGLMLLAIVLGSATGLFISRFITTAVAKVGVGLGTINSICISNLANAVQALEHGDLTCAIQTGSVPIDLNYRDEFGQVAKTYNVLLEKTQATVASFRISQISLSTLIAELQASALDVDHSAN